MIRTPYFSFSFILFISLAAIVFWLDQMIQPTSTTLDAALYQQPDYIIENISGLRVDHDKTIRRVFLAKKMRHYIHQDLTQLENTRFLSSEIDQPPFRVFADQAEVHGNGENIFLADNITILRGTDDDNGKITMETDALHLIPDESLAKTEDAVTISRMNTTIHAVGFELNNQTGMIELLSQVRAVDQ